MGISLHHSLVTSQLLGERDAHLLLVRLQMWSLHHLVNVLDLAFYDTQSMNISRCYLLIESKTTFFGFLSGGSLCQDKLYQAGSASTSLFLKGF